MTVEVIVIARLSFGKPRNLFFRKAVSLPLRARHRRACQSGISKRRIGKPIILKIDCEPERFSVQARNDKSILSLRSSQSQKRLLPIACNEKNVVSFRS